MSNHDTNVDQAEIAKFEQLAHKWWDENSEFKPLHDINPLRANYIDQRAELPGKLHLDIGCGGGLLTEACTQRGAKSTGIDMGEAPLSVAKLHALESELDIEYLQVPAEKFAEERPEHYDVVTCLEMLEHVPDPASIVKACDDLCKPGGQLFFSTINRNPKSYAFAIIGAEYLLRLLPKGTHEYSKFIKPAELAHAIRAAGLELVESTGMVYNPLTKKYSLSDSDLDVNYLMHARKPL